MLIILQLNSSTLWNSLQYTREQKHVVEKDTLLKKRYRTYRNIQSQIYLSDYVSGKNLLALFFTCAIKCSGSSPKLFLFFKYIDAMYLYEGNVNEIQNQKETWTMQFNNLKSIYILYMDKNNNTKVLGQQSITTATLRDKR